MYPNRILPDRESNQAKENAQPFKSLGRASKGETLAKGTDSCRKIGAV